jgi:ABC-type thiamin/hydroxymethylpyrimidine transport system permease subunit
LCKINQLLTIVVPILIALAVVYFIWGVITYVLSSDEEAKTQGRNRIIYGIIGLAVIVAVWGLVKILTNTFGVSDVSQTITLPTTPY